MARRLARGGHRVVAYNRTTEKAVSLAQEEDSVEAAETLEALADLLQPPRIAWSMVPAGPLGADSENAGESLSAGLKGARADVNARHRDRQTRQFPETSS